MTTVSEQLAYHGLLPQDWRDVTAPPPGIALDAAEAAGEFGEETLDTGALRRLVATLALRSDLWKPLVVSDRARRRYRLMLEDERIDVWVLSWMPGQATGFHDHGNSNVALTTLQGVVLERQLRAAEASFERALRPGFVQTGPAGSIHAVNHQSGAPAVTLHAYSPPLLQVGQYRATPGGALLREQQHGRQELLDHTIAEGRGI
jgi:predicted metal-dependent enzyme (double-stranded beta helix superfamily)